MTKACATRLWLPAVLLAGILLGAFGGEVRAQSSGVGAKAAQSAPATLSPDRKVKLERAAKLADAGSYSAAMAIYRQVFGSHPPPADWALAYYETEAATEGGRPQAEDGLRALVEKYPDDPRYQVSLGRVLTYDPATREEGRKYLAKFPGNPQAAQALRQSLLWDAANPAVAAQIRAYLAVHLDTQLAAVFQVAQPAAAKGAAAAVDGKGAPAASSAVASSMPIVVTPAPAIAVGSVPGSSSLQPAPGSVALAEDKSVVSPSANAAVISPTAVTPTAAPAVNSPVTSGGLVAAAPPSVRTEVGSSGTEANEELQNLDLAQRLLQRLVMEQTNAGEKPSAAIEMQLAKIYAERGKPQLAYPVYQQVLRENPERADAWAGLLSALHVTGHDKEAVAQVELIPASARTQLQTNESYLQTMAAVNALVGPTHEALGEAAASQGASSSTGGMTKSQSVAAAEGYSSFVPYVAPATRAARETGDWPGRTTAVTVQPGNDAPHPVPAQAEITDVLPTARFGPNARANQATASHAEAAAARAELIRRMQEDGADALREQSHPPSEETTTGTMQKAQSAGQPQVRRPASPPGGMGAAPDTGTQQYPQPGTRPGANGSTIPRSRPVQRAAASARTSAATPKEPVPQTEAAAPAVVATVPSAVSAVPRVAPTEETHAPSRVIAQGSAAAAPAYPLPPPPPDAELKALPALGGSDSGVAATALMQQKQAENELALLGSYSGWLGVTGIARYRSGTSGLDRLYDLESPAEVSIVMGRQVRMTVVAEPVFLNSGTLNPADFLGANVPYFGTLALDAANLPARQFFNGVGGELQLAAKSFAVAVGYAPYEFPVRNVTGRFLWNGIGNHVSLFGDREPVKDTLLSYVGLHDPGSSAPSAQSSVWGGVVASTGGLRLQFGGRAANFFVAGEGGILTGQHVLDNYRYKGTVGAAFRVKSWANGGELRLGGELSGMHYQHNEAGLTYGQGGYFSPYTYFAVSVPLRFEGHYRTNFHYTLAGSIGAQRFRQNAALFYPLDPGLQFNLVASKGAACTSALAATYDCGEYPLIDSTQLSYAFDSEASYRFGGHWYGGGFVFANNFSNFDTVSAGVFLHYVFRSQHSREGYPAGLFQVDGLRSLRIP